MASSSLSSMHGIKSVADAPAPSLAVKLRQARSESMISEVEAVALELFAERGFDAVTVEEVAAAAQISVRTFYRYVPTKEHVLQIQIDQRNAAISAALVERPAEETPLESLRIALAEVIAAEDPALLRRWVGIVASTPSVMNSVLGGIVLKSHRTFAEHLGTRLGLPGDALIPTMLAGAVGGVIQAATTSWFVHGGDLAATLSAGLEVLERGIGADPNAWPRGADGSLLAPGP
jgi:AcrR family transcriptional regulator